MKRFPTVIFLLLSQILLAQNFYLGADLSYVNEMEDCGVEYFENQVKKDPYQIFSDHGCNLVRLRLWHSPKWYEDLNSGKRYSDLADVKKAIERAHQNNMEVLLDFHLSDNWADPSKQLVPAAWELVVDDLPVLSDSLYNYIFKTLSDLNDENLLPEMIQIGNETNKGILLSAADNAVWTLDWLRNATLFNRGIQAVKDFEQVAGKEVKIALHVAGPSNAEWIIDEFYKYGVRDFDIIGMSYYWAWHKPTTISQTGEIIETLRTLYPDKKVMVLETGYIWTNQWNDNASNIITETHPDYSPASPENQRDWLIELTKEVIDSDGSGVIYWEPAWVSSGCRTQWGEGSHQEHATFFNFDNNLLLPGGIEWMNFNYGLSSFDEKEVISNPIQILSNSFSGDITIKQHGKALEKLNYIVADSTGKIILSGNAVSKETFLKLENASVGIYIISVRTANRFVKSKKILLE